MFGLICGQIIGRWGNFTNREAFGDYTNSLFAMRLPIEMVRQNEITAKIAHQLDEEMGKIRDDIQEAQALFDPLSRKLNDGVGNSDDTDEEYR
mgnify:CR=1 FL=1